MDVKPVSSWFSIRRSSWPQGGPRDGVRGEVVDEGVGLHEDGITGRQVGEGPGPSSRSSSGWRARRRSSSGPPDQPSRPYVSSTQLAFGRTATSTLSCSFNGSGPTGFRTPPSQTVSTVIGMVRSLGTRADDLQTILTCRGGDGRGPPLPQYPCGIPPPPRMPCRLA